MIIFALTVAYNYMHNARIFAQISWCFNVLTNLEKSLRDVPRTLIGGGGGYSYIQVLPDGFLLNLTEAQKNEINLFYIKIKLAKIMRRPAT